MRNSEVDLKNFLLKHELDWSLEDIRKTPKIKRKNRILDSSFDQTEYQNKILKKLNNQETELKKNILFSHFSPFLTEIEGIGLPLYFKTRYPNCNVHMTYDKGNKESIKYNIKKDGIFERIDSLSNSYDLVIARSSSLINMMKRKDDRLILNNSSYKINIKTMSFSPNLKYADFYFKEKDMCPPPDIIYSEKIDKFLKTNDKKNIITISGTLWYVKNQLSFFKAINPNILKEFDIVVLGPERDRAYVNEIRKLCSEKNINYFLIGNIDKDLASKVKALSKISVIPMDMRVFGQPEGYPRTLGESIASKCLTLCNDPITVPSFYEKSVVTYDAKNFNDLNNKLEECIGMVSKENFFKNHNWGEKGFIDFCEETIEKCLNLSKLL